MVLESVNLKVKWPDVRTNKPDAKPYLRVRGLLNYVRKFVVKFSQSMAEISDWVKEAMPMSSPSATRFVVMR